MSTLANPFVTVSIDDRFPRVLSWESRSGGVAIHGQPQSVEPRVYLFRRSDRATLTTDDRGVQAWYDLTLRAGCAVWHAMVTVESRPAVEFDVTLELRGLDAVLRMDNVREHEGYCLYSFRMERLVSAHSRDGDSRMLTCYTQGRVLDPAKCKPNLIDYSWSGPARLCGAVYRKRFMVTLEVPGYEDIMVQEVRSYGRIPDDPRIASLGAEVMYRQRMVEAPDIQYPKYSPDQTPPRAIPPEKPVLCGDTKEVRLHFVFARSAAVRRSSKESPLRGHCKPLDWTDAAKYFQSQVSPDLRCNKLYDDTFVYKISFGNGATGEGFYTFDRAADLIRRIHNYTDGMKQVCYFAGFQHNFGDSGWPQLCDPNPAAGTVRDVRRVMRLCRQKYNTIVSFHGNIDVFSDDSPIFDPDYIARYTSGKLFSQGYWGSRQLYVVSFPAFRKQLEKIVREMIRKYGIRDTLHLDTFSGPTYVYDAHPARPFNATQYLEAKLDLVKAINRMGIDITSEVPTHPYLPYIGHIWALFNFGTTWEGEEAVPFANFMYHGAASWNAARSPSTYRTPLDEKAILECLVQGGGSGIEFPNSLDNGWGDIVASLYLVQEPYNRLRGRRWTGYHDEGGVRRVEYGKGSFIEVDDAKPGYRVVVDGVIVAKDFATVLTGRKKGSFLAFSRSSQTLDWPAPKGMKSGPVQGITLTESGPGIPVQGVVKNGRLKIKLEALVPVRLWQ